MGIGTRQWFTRTHGSKISICSNCSDVEVCVSGSTEGAVLVAAMLTSSVPFLDTDIETAWKTFLSDVRHR